jgi:DNA end-binding protein Ku
MSTQELKALEAVTSDEISIREFVPARTVDPIYIERSYYLGPNRGGDRAYRLFHDALEHSKLVGIAAFAARGKQYTVMVRPYEDALELQLAARVIEELREDAFDASDYHDEVKERVRKLIATKAKGVELVVPTPAKRAELPDLISALRASLPAEGAPRQAAQRKTSVRQHATRHAGGRPHRPRPIARRARTH